ncbi:MAG: aldo/keto reductase [Cellulosilyticaceae bacterium]
MLKRTYKDTGLEISTLGLGCMRLPKVSTEGEEIDFEKAQEIVDYAYANGINYYDTAYIYHGGQSEEFIGGALKKYPRDTYNLVTKMPIWRVEKKEDVEQIFNEQLKNCQVEYFDFYLCHAINEDNFKQYIEYGAYEFLSKMKEEGKIRYLGFSFHDKPHVMENVCDTYKWDFAQIQLNYLDWEMQDAKRQYEILEERGIPCIVMEPVRGGVLANPCEASNELFKEARPDKSIASWAIRYAASLPNVLTVLSGMSNLDQIKDNVETMTHFEPLTEKDHETIGRALEAYKKKDTVPCTGCRYCMDCPLGVDIPEMFKIYNDYAVSKNKDQYHVAYHQTDEGLRVHHCIACGKCTTHCPQSIQIPEKMKMIKDLIEKLFKD